MTAVDLAIKNLPKKDKEYRSYAFALRADVYVSMENIDNALRDYATAIELTPERAKLYERRANLYYQLEKYSLADKDYQKLIALNQGSVMGYMGIGRNANAQKRYEDAVAQFDYVIKLASDYASGYSFRAESYIGLKQYNEAIDDVIKAMVIDGRDRKAFYQMQALADLAFIPLVVKLKVQKAKSTDKGMWAYNLGVVHEQKEKCAGAVAFYKESLANDSSPLAAYRIANCLDEMGDNVQALEYSNQAIALDSTDYDYIMQKADIEIGRANGEHRIEKAILDALNSPLLNNVDIEKAHKLLYIIYSCEKSPVVISELSEVDDFMDGLSPDIEVLWGLYPNNTLEDDVKVAIIATGFDDKCLDQVSSEDWNV